MLLEVVAVLMRLCEFLKSCCYVFYGLGDIVIWFFFFIRNCFLWGLFLNLMSNDGKIEVVEVYKLNDYII